MTEDWQFYVAQPNTNRDHGAELWPCWRLLWALHERHCDRRAILPKWLTRKHIAVSHSLLSEPRVPLFLSHIHSTNMCQAPTIGQAQCWTLIPSQICVTVPSICPCPSLSLLVPSICSQIPILLQVLLACQPLSLHVTCWTHFPQSANPTPQSCLSAFSPASEEHVWTRVPSEVRGGKKRGLRACWVGGSSWRCGRRLCWEEPSRSWDVGSLGLEPDRAVEGAAGSTEGHGGDVAVTTRR